MEKLIQIIYATGSGNTEIVCEEVEKILDKKNIKCILSQAELTSIDVIKDNDLFILATSTWEHGEINPYFDKLLVKMQKQNLEDKKAGFIGLGDNRYEKFEFCAGIEILKKVFLNNGGIQIANTLKIQGDPHDQLDLRVVPWTQRFIQELNKF